MGWLKRIGIAGLVLGLAAAVPIARNEFACMSPRDASTAAYQPLLPQAERRNLVDTFLTYPEWSIVHAYDDLAAVTRARGEHHFGYWSAISGFWGSLCDLSKVASRRGEITGEMKAMLYIIGVSFAGEMAVKGLYETSIGRLTAWLRGPERTPDDHFAAKVAEDYAAFLRQTPWYEYPFWAKLSEYWSHAEPGKPSVIRTVERRIALTLEYGVKGLYAKGMGVLAGAAPAKLTIQSIVTGLPESQLRQDRDVTIIGTRPEGLVIETQRYRTFTEVLGRIAARNGDVREIAGNDRIFVTAISPAANRPADGGFTFRAPAGAGIDRPARATVMFSVPVQAKPGSARLGIELAVADLAAFMRAAPGLSLTFEHAYDY